MKKILITGTSGFVGSRVAKAMALMLNVERLTKTTIRMAH
jgi:nucleoside-diphosphate-sugar epimerase